MLRLEEEVKSARDEKTSAVDSLERQHVQEAENLKKEMELQLETAKHLIKEQAKEDLDELVKHTMKRNRELEIELRFQSKETERLINKTNRLEDEKKFLRTEIRLLQEEIRKLSVKKKSP